MAARDVDPPTFCYHRALPPVSTIIEQAARDNTSLYLALLPAELRVSVGSASRSLGTGVARRATSRSSV